MTSRPVYPQGSAEDWLVHKGIAGALAPQGKAGRQAAPNVVYPPEKVSAVTIWQKRKLEVTPIWGRLPRGGEGPEFPHHSSALLQPCQSFTQSSYAS